ncbi:MAG: OB-fold nucleic acid binding domain-containing protein, partial [Oscillospiraceae bacterium]|nr:OB-fold nucleic acid binding domain-containing protein [Oscillospiraceae bacterium]
MSDMNTPENQELSEILQIRHGKLEALRRENRDPFAVTVFERDAYAKQIVDAFESYDGKRVSVAGRVMSWRDMGKASFLDLADSSGRIQLYIKLDDVGEETYAGMKNWDIGDIIGVSGEAFRTRRGEISVKAQTITLLSKSLQPLPEKFHGLKDTDLRYRQRYVDLIVNPDVRETFVKRSKILSAIRGFMTA